MPTDREWFEQRMADHEKHVDSWFQHLKAEVRLVRDHNHPGHVTYPVLITTVIGLATLAWFVFG